MIAAAGIFSLWRLWIYALAFLLMGVLLGAAWRRAGVLTDAELVELRYGTRLATLLRAAKAVYFGTLFNCMVLAMVLFAATRIAEPFLHWEQWLPARLFDAVVHFVEVTQLSLSSVSDPALAPQRSANNLLSLIVIVGVTGLYSTTGGLRAVVNTDLLQFALAMIASLAYAVAVVDRVGGLSEVPARLAALYGSGWASETLAFTPGRARDAGWVVLGTIAIQWFAQINADGSGYLAQRTMACRSDRDARDAALILVVAQILLRSLLWIAIGLGLLILLPMTPGAADDALIAAREQTFVEGIALYLPPGLQGLMLAGLLAALASTLDTHLNWGASYWANDLYRRLICQLWLRREPSGRRLVWVARLSNLLILLLAIAILTRLESIQSAWKLSLLLGAGMGGPLLLRWFWWRVTAGAELAAIATSLVLAPVLLWTLDGEGARILVQSAATTCVAIGVALKSPAEPHERMLDFYRRVQPPGFWGPVALRCGESPRCSRERLARGLRMTIGLALCLFGVLVGAGSWLFGSPPPAWFPWRGPWIAALLGSSALLLVWLRPRLRSG
jgi:Na+/proline symporter